MSPGPPCSTVAPASCPTAPGTTGRIRAITGSTVSTPGTTSTASSATSTAPVIDTFRPHMERGFRYFKATFFEPVGTAQVLSRPRLSDRYPVRIAGNRDVGEVRRRRSRCPADRREGRTVDDPEHAGSERLLLLPKISPPGREDPHAPLGAGDDVSGAGVAVADGRTRETIGREYAPACLGPAACWA